MKRIVSSLVILGFLAMAGETLYAAQNKKEDASKKTISVNPAISPAARKEAEAKAKAAADSAHVADSLATAAAAKGGKKK